MPPESVLARRGRRRWHWWLGTVLGVGCVPLAPGTAASLFALAIAWALGRCGAAWLVGGSLLAFALGLWSAHTLARELGEPDPAEVVVDEVCGQLLAMWFLPPTAGVLLASFFLFRAFDIFKPPPGRLAERARGGLGIMLDDVVAAVYANLLLHGGLYLAGRWS